MFLHDGLGFTVASSNSSQVLWGLGISLLGDFLFILPFYCFLDVLFFVSSFFFFLLYFRGKLFFAPSFALISHLVKSRSKFVSRESFFLL